MGKIYTIFTIAAIAASVNANGEFRHGSVKLSDYTKNQPVTVIQRARSAYKVAKSAAPVYKPLHEVEYEYFDGEWSKWCDYNYEYDNRGNILVTVSDDGEVKSRTTQTYNSDNLFTEKIGEVAEDGENYVNSTRQTRAFDPVVKDLVTELQSYTWQNDQWVKYGNSNKRDITRNAQGNVTEVVISTWYMDSYAPVLRQTITYDDRALASVWRQDAMTMEGTWEESLTLSDMEWYKTDGQITSDDYSSFFEGNNLLKSAKVTENGENVGMMQATYDETGATDNRTIVLTYFPLAPGEVVGWDVYTYAYTDNNGSLTVTQKYYEDADGDGKMSEDELMELYVTTVAYDNQGNLTLYESTMDGELMEGEKYEYAYDEATGAVKETVAYALNFDTLEYAPMMKIVADNFVDVSASVEGIEAAPDARKEVYTLQGVRVGDSVDILPAGIYIVREGAKVTKVIKGRR